VEGPSRRFCGWRVQKTERGKDWFEIRDLFANEGCSQAILDVLAITDIGRQVLKPAEEDVKSKASAWELWGRNGGNRCRRAGPDSGQELTSLCITMIMQVACNKSNKG